MAAPLPTSVGLITGAAGSIGSAVAESLLGEGARLVLADRSATALAELASRWDPERVVTIAGDVADPDHVSAAVELATTRFGGLDLLFANAGIFGAVAEVADYPVDVFDEVMRVNVRGSFLTCRAALAVMRDGGAIVVNSSVVGLTSDPGICAYATSKHALVGLMRTAAKEGAARGIRVNSIHPGPTDNDFQHAIETTATGLDRDAAAGRFEQMIPLGRHADAREVAATVTFLMSPAAAFITGATVAVDGGMSV